MKVITLAVFILCGCATFEPPDSSYTLPEVIYQSSLPPWPFHTDNYWISLTFKIYVAADGSVRNAVIETPTGSRAWDTLALAEVRTWRYSPALMNGQPTALWLRQTLRVHFDKPVYLLLADITCPDQATADSLYALLRAGASFDSLARRHSISISKIRGGMDGEIDIHSFPIHVSKELAVLHAGEISKPLKLGRTYVIYRRVPNDV
ncbi:MAG TPA: TonB family protein [Bacteroidota bacterium]|nr:TonB family protein [Bacteroidota bacterium]